MTTRVSCSHCHTLAHPGECPECGHDNDRPRIQCNCYRCREATCDRLGITMNDRGD